MIEVKGLRKVYHLSKKQRLKRGGTASKLVAVDGVDFKVKRGEIFGLLGPNGAGKTTTLRCLSTLIPMTAGEARIDGHDVKSEGELIRGKLAFLTNELKLDEHFTPEETMQFFGGLYGLSRERVAERTEHLFSTFGIGAFRGLKIAELSTGMKQKLSIAVSLVHDPDVIIFDEPTNGLDIITARQVTDHLLSLKERGKTLIISTHIMTVAEGLCDHLAILLGGKIVARGTTAEIMAREGADNLEDAFFSLYQKTVGGDAHVS